MDKEANKPDPFFNDYAIRHGFKDDEGEQRPLAYVSAYTVTRHYGGPEEGGWWFNWNELHCSSPVTDPEAAHAEGHRFKELFGNLEHGNIYSVLGGTELLITLDREPGEQESTERPRYE